MSNVDTVPDDPALEAVEGLGPRAAAFGRAFAFIVIYVLFIGVMMMAAGPLVMHRNAGGQASVHALASDSTVTTIIEVISIVSGVLASVIVLFRSRLSARDIGFRPVGVGKGLLVGTALGLFLLSAIMAALINLHHVQLAPFDLHGEQGPLWFARFALLFTAVALNEELAMRGPLLTLLGRAIGFWPAALLTSLIFMSLHIPNPGETPLGLANVFIVGIVLAWSRRRTGALWLAIGFHAAWDFAQSYLFGVPDSGTLIDGAITRATISGPDWLSGGVTGPEGGVLTTISMVGIFVIVNILWPKPRQAA